MKKILVVVVLGVLLMSLPAFAAEREVVRSEAVETWQSRRDGVMVDDGRRTLSMLVPSPGATPAQVRAIVRSELKKFTKEHSPTDEGREQHGTIVSPGGDTFRVRVIVR